MGEPNKEGRLNYEGCCPITHDGSWPDEVPSHNLNHDHSNSGTIKVESLLIYVILPDSYNA